MKYLLISFLFFVHCSAQAAWHSRYESTMGTRVGVELWHDDEVQAERIMAEVMEEMTRINQTMSPYIESSELSEVNRQAADNPVAVSLELFALLSKAQRFSVLSEGAFDISFASVGYQYDYRAQQRPDKDALAAGAYRIDYRQVQLDPELQTVKFGRQGMRIDLGGIAKGHAVDLGIAVLQKHGVKHGLVNAGGDTRLLGDRRGRPWVVGVKDPRVEDKQAVLLPLVDEAISTSGDYERYFEEDGVRYHHILNPMTGDSAREVQSVTVLAPDSTTADALSTTVFVLGVERGLALVESMANVEAIIIDNQRKMHYSSDLAPPE
ncbi:FAD:protein FMN transferase [Corallincola holothuriorum]|uniref:FAD:protein FMN transferase n=2 Tax=Corallincola holothuriorum TaxID=2282215 RepID=A0A368NIP6_9GAMM|nr:FAD:protein FMN transferase [Corallincola holothuriorum]